MSDFFTELFPTSGGLNNLEKPKSSGYIRVISDDGRVVIETSPGKFREAVLKVTSNGVVKVASLPKDDTTIDQNGPNKGSDAFWQNQVDQAG